MDPNNIKLCKPNGLYFIKDQYRKDSYFGYEDAYNYYDIDVNKMSLFKQSDNEYFIRFKNLNKQSGNCTTAITKKKKNYGEIQTIMVIK